MQSAVSFESPAVARLPLPASGTQWLPVSGYITDRLFVTFRAESRRLLPLVPEPFRLDVRDGFGFVSVCAVEILGMTIASSPFRFDNREFLYRIAVRLGNEPTFLTLRSDVSSRILAVLGRHFSHYRPNAARVALERHDGRLSMTATTRDGAGDAELDVDTRAGVPRTSVFADAGGASDFLLGMKFSADVVERRVRVQPIDHGPWNARTVRANVARFAFIESLEARLGASLTYDSTLSMGNIHQTWRAARWH